MNHDFLKQLQDQTYVRLKQEGADALDPARRAEKTRAHFRPALGSIAIGWALAEHVFGFPYAARWTIVPVGALAGAALALAAGWLSLRSVLRAPPLVTLRNA